MAMKLVIGTKQGKCLQKELSDEEAKVFWGKKIGAKIAGDDVGFAGYEFELTGGSDHSGFPMRKDIEGIGRKKILAVSGIGLKKKARGIRQRKTVCGNTVHPKIAQVNMRVLKEGAAPLFEEAEKPEEKPEAVEGTPKKPEMKEAPAEEKPAEKPEKAPAEEKKEESEEKPAEKPEKPEEKAETPKEDKPVEKSEEQKPEKEEDSEEKK